MNKTAPRKTYQKTGWSALCVVSIISFALLCALVFLDEYLDLPHRLAGAPATPVNLIEVRIECAAILAVGLLCVLFLRLLSIRRARAQAGAARLNLMLSSIRNVNQLIIREKDRGPLIEEACKILTSSGGFDGAWIALMDGRGRVERFSQSGLKAGNVPACAERAMAHPRILTVLNTASECPDCPLAKAYKGNAASLTALRHDGEVYGVLAVSLPPSFAIDPEIQGLLMEVAGDIAFSLWSRGIEESRAKAEKALQDREQRFQSTLDGLLEGCQIIGFDWRYLYLNKVALSHGRFGKDKILGRTMMEAYPGIENTAMFKKLKESMEKRVSHRMESEFVFPDGSKGWFDLSIEPVPEGAFILSQDVTSRRMDENALKESEERFRVLFDNSAQGILVADVETMRFLYANASVCRMFGYSQGEMLKLSVSAIHPRDALKHVMSEFESQARGEKTLSPGLPCLRSDGAVFHADVSSAPAVIGGRKCNIGFFMDVTKRKQAEEELTRLSTAIEQASEAIVITDARAVIQYVNPAFEAITRYTRAEALGQNPRILKSGRQDEAFYRGMWGILASGKTWRGKLVNKRKDGRLYTEEATISPVKDAAGTIVNYVAVKRDVTRELSLEEQYLQSQKMEAIGRLAAGVAHDLNNMLFPILGYSDLLLRDAGPDHPERQALEFIHGAGLRATDIVRQLLAFGRRQTFEVNPVDLNRIIGDFENLLKRTLREDVSIEKKLFSPLPLVLADTGQVEQVIMNLAINSQDAMPAGGRIILETAVVDLDESYTSGRKGVKPGRYVMLAVSDSGCGMDKATRARVFEPFFTTKEKGKGTGLGLSTVYGIVKQHNGSIWLYSEPGKGTTFKIYLPVTAQEASAAPAAAFKNLGSLVGAETVLVVEDNDDVRGLAERMLRDQGYSVLSASGGKAALGLIASRSGPIHILLTDVIMPDMNGRQLYQAASARFPEMKVIYMSGYTDDVIAHHGVLDKGITLLQKPFSAKALALKVREVLDG